MPADSGSHETPRRYAAALAVVAAAAALRWALLHVAGVAPPYVTFYFAVMLAAGYGGLGPGLLATGLGALLGIAPWPGEQAHPAMLPDQLRVLLFVLGGCGVSFIAGRMHDARRRAIEEARRSRQASDELRQANARLSEADRAKNRFMALLAHELRNPLMPIRNALLLAGSPQEDRRQRALAVVERQVQHLNRLVEDLLDLSRIETDKLALVRSCVDLRELTRQTLDDWESLFVQRGLRLSLHTPMDPLWVHVDRARMMQVLGNLLSNSLKFTAAGGEVHVWLAASTAAPDTPGTPDASKAPAAPAGPGFALLRVQDSGCGIPAKVLPRVFDSFAQGEHDNPGGGLGLGLTLVRQLVEMHGGSVEAFSPGEACGAEFLLRLPLVDPPRAARAPDSSQAMPAEAPGQLPLSQG